MESESFADPIIWWFPHAVLSIFRENAHSYMWELVPIDAATPRAHGTAVTPAAAIRQALALMPTI
jgi:hypothetical protein